MKRLFTSRLLKLSVVATALTLFFNSQASCANDDVSSNTAANIVIRCEFQVSTIQGNIHY